MAVATRFVYDFDETSEGGKELLGGKGAGLAEMTSLGVPVPAGFTVTTDACRAYMTGGGELPGGLEEEIDRHLAALEEKSGKRFGDADDPLLVSVRSGAAVSMPGMMDTILNLGLNDEAVEGLASRTDNPRFARDSYRRLVQMTGEVVDGIDADRFERALSDLKAVRGVGQDVDLTSEDLFELIETFRRIYGDETGRDFPQDPREQLRRAVRAVFDSWETPRAQVYRRAHARSRHGRGGPDLEGGGRRQDRPGTARSAPPPDDRSDGRLRGRGQGAERVAGGRERSDRLRRGHGCRPRRRGGKRDPRPLGDDTGRHPRDDCRAGDPDRPRRDDVARGGRRARDGQAVHRRLRGAERRRGREEGHAWRGGARRGRHDYDRRLERPRHDRRGPARTAAAERRLRDDPRVGGRAAPPEGARERGHARGRRARAGVWRAGDRSLPDGAHVHGDR